MTKQAASARAAETFAAYGGLPSYRAMLDREGVAGPADIAIIGTAMEVQERIGALAGSVSPTSPQWSRGTPDEVANTREALKGLLG